ncbi:MAG: DUF58 domain-containing protein [bacterium]
MSPSLAITGKLVLASGLAFLVVGAVLSDPIILLLGQVHIVMLVMAVMALIPSALVLDRRVVRVATSAEGGARAGTGHVMGERESLHIVIENPSLVALHHFKATPYASSGISVSTPEGIVSVGAGQQVEREFHVSGNRTGRWVLHGFDVSVHDPFGLVETRDYLPAVHAFEFYPFAGWIRRRRSMRGPTIESMSGLHVVDAFGSGTEIREMRDWHSGDSLRDIAWKPSVRARRLVSREFEREITTTSYVVLDISSSMRGGQRKGAILDHGIHIAVDLVDRIIDRNDRVGFMTFDEKLYGHITPNSGTGHMKRILHHIVGLMSVVDQDLTELDDVEVFKLAADYALVQERLDFRKGNDVDPESGVNEALLERWISSGLAQTQQKLSSPVLREGVVAAKPKLVREFLQLRGVEVPYRVEARLGMKERGLGQAIEQMAVVRPKVQHVTIITDLCGIMNVEPILRALRALQRQKVRVEFVVLFGPAFYEVNQHADERYDAVRGLFTSAEAEERSRLVQKLRAAGIDVKIVRPSAPLLAKQAAVDYARA